MKLFFIHTPSKEVVDMSIKPIDFQVMLPKAIEVSKVHSDEQHKNQAVQQQQTASTQHSADRNARQVHSQESVQEARIRERRERNQGKEKKKSKQDKGKNSDENSSTIDIRL